MRDADVSRTAAYRCWPRRDDFVADLLADLAAVAVPVGGERGPQATAALRRVVTARPGRLRTVGGRREVLLEAVTAAAVDDLEAETAAGWRMYLSLALALPALPAGDGRDRVVAAVAEAEDALLTRLERGYRAVLELLGFAPRAGYGALAGVANALFRGLVVGGQAGSDAGRAVAAAMAVLVDGGTEPVDDADWNEERIAVVVDAVAAEDVFAVGSSETDRRRA